MNSTTVEPEWAPFELAATDAKPEAPRPISTVEGVGDRLRAAGFAEIQAREAFRWAADRFGDEVPGLAEAWRALAIEEEKHLNWLLARLKVIGQSVTGRKVSNHLWRSFQVCTTAREFALYMANAEERGRVAGERFGRDLVKQDPETARIFAKIAEEEISHIALARKFFPDAEINAFGKKSTSAQTVTSGA